MNARTWTQQQTAVFRWLDTPTARRALAVNARAGTGKTSTIVEGLDHAPEVRGGGRVLLAAFNKRIASELEGRVPRGVRVSTLHALGCQAVIRAWGRMDRPNQDRGATIAGALLQPHLPVGFTYANSSSWATRKSPQAVEFNTLCGLVAKLAGVGKRTLTTDACDLADVAWSYDAEPSKELIAAGWTTLRLATLAVEAMQAACEQSAAIDFDDMLWLPWACGLAPQTFDLVVIDEAQDMDAAQLELAIAAVAPGGRVVVVGDPRQAIYGFMGAASGAFERTRARLDALELPLSVTFRCPASVVDAARVYVPDYQAAPGAPRGVVEMVPKLAHAVPRIAAGDFVLSRTNAGAVAACMALLRHGTRATVIGRDIGASIIARVKGFKRAYSVPDVILAARAWALTEQQQAEAAGRPQRAERAADMCETIITLAEGLDSVEALLARIKGLFDEAAQVGQVACCTVHRSKGLEARAVWIIADSFRDSDSVEEQNLRYVAITRAIGSLHIVGEGPFGACLQAAAAAPQMRLPDVTPFEEDFGPDHMTFDGTH